MRSEKKTYGSFNTSKGTLNEPRNGDGYDVGRERLGEEEDRDEEGQDVEHRPTSERFGYRRHQERTESEHRHVGEASSLHDERGDVRVLGAEARRDGAIGLQRSRVSQDLVHKMD